MLHNHNVMVECLSSYSRRSSKTQLFQSSYCSFNGLIGQRINSRKCQVFNKPYSLKERKKSFENSGSLPKIKEMGHVQQEFAKTNTNVATLVPKAPLPNQEVLAALTHSVMYPKCHAIKKQKTPERP